jgi:microcystin-dependent protein
MWAGSSENVPDNWLLCDGTAISRTTYDDLYTIQGNVFGGGDGSTTFNLPDMRDRFVVGAGSSYARNAQGGSTSNDIGHTHTVNSHSHSIAQHSHTVISHRHYTGAHSHTSGSIVAHIFRNSTYQMYLQNVSSGVWGGTHLINIYNSSNNGAGHATAVGTSGSTGSTDAGYTDYQSPGTSTAGATSTGNTSPSTNSSGSSSLENRPPYIGILYIIKVLS